MKWRVFLSGHFWNSTSDIETIGETFDGNGTLTLLRVTQAAVLIVGGLVPDLNGEALVGEVKKQDPSLRMIVVTTPAMRDNGELLQGGSISLHRKAKSGRGSAARGDLPRRQNHL